MKIFPRGIMVLEGMGREGIVSGADNVTRISGEGGEGAPASRRSEVFRIPCAIEKAELREVSKDEAGDAGQWYMCIMYNVHEVRAMEQKGQ